MFPFPRKKKPNEPKPPLPKWAVWAIFLSLFYLVIIGNVSRLQEPVASPALSQSQKAPAGIDKTLSETLAPAGDFPAIRRTFNASNWQRVFNPTLAEGLRTQDKTVGAGREVACGDTVTAYVEAKDAQGNPIKTALYDKPGDNDKSLSFTVGQHAVFPALERSIVGMKVGGNRIIDAPPALVFEELNIAQGLSNIVLYVDLLALSPAWDKNAAPLLSSPPVMLDDEAMLCGKSLSVDVTIWDAAGKRVATLRDVAITLGDSHTPLGLSQALIGLANGASRTLTIPPHMQQHRGKAFAALDGKQVRIVKVTRIK